MGVELPQAFISYTSELQEECDAVQDVCLECDFHPRSYKKIGASKDVPIDVIRRELSNSEVYLGILGGRHGSECPPPAGRSVVEFEYQYFKEQKQVNGDEPYDIGIYPKYLPETEIEPKQLVFRGKFNLTNGGWVKEYRSIDQLKYHISVTLGRWKGRYQNARNQAEEPDKARAHEAGRFSGGIVFALAILVTISAILPLGISNKTAYIIILCLAWCIVLFWARTRINS